MSRYCEAKTRAGGPCRRPAGWGTDHRGEGRCKLHGGKSTGPPTGSKNARTHGAYETVIRERLDVDQQVIFDAVPADEDLRQELRILRFKLLRLLEPVERQVIAGTKDSWDVAALEVDEVTKAYAIEKLVDGIRKLVKEMQGTEADDPLLEWVGMMQELRAARREARDDDT